MDGSITLRPSQRKILLDQYRKGTDPQLRLRAHILLLLAAGQSWLTISLVLFCSTATIARWKQRYEQGGIDAVLHPGQHPGRPAQLWSGWASVVVRWVQGRFPLDFGYVRSRWCCATLALVLWDVHHVHVCAETVRRWLHRHEMVWRRPRPALDRKDPNQSRKLRAIRLLLGHLPPDEIAFFQDEVDVSTNPRIGCMWMRRGQQAKVPTPGDSHKRYLAGSMDWRTGRLLVTEGTGRNADLFLAHLDQLRCRYRGYHRIHVICDNARFHQAQRCKKVAEYLRKQGHRIQLHYLPKYAPETNPIERVWWHLHQEVTRNHRCFNIQELVQMVMRWLDERGPFRIERHVYDLLQTS
jgi:putative transposase